MLDSIENVLEAANKSLFGGNASRILDTMRLCVDYNLLKENYELEENVSTIEKFLFVVKLIRLVDEQPVINELNFKQFGECRRKLKLFLLDDLYGLNKAEKNWLQMSFIRKQQADLLEWTCLNKYFIVVVVF